MNQVLEAVACKELGFPEETTLNGLLCAVLSRLLGSERLTKEKLVKQLPLFETGLTSATADAVRARWFRTGCGGRSRRSRDRSPPSHLTWPPSPRPCGAGGHSPPQDRFHDNKVFIAALWRATRREPNFPRLSLPEFKQRLVEANSRNLLHLSRADLVQAMDPQMVAESETVYLNATFHFVLLEGTAREHCRRCRRSPGRCRPAPGRVPAPGCPEVFHSTQRRRPSGKLTRTTWKRSTRRPARRSSGCCTAAAALRRRRHPGQSSCWRARRAAARRT